MQTALTEPLIIMSTYLAWPTLILCGALAAASPLTHAQDAPKGQPILEPLIEDELAEAPSGKRGTSDKASSTETRLPGGRVTGIEVRSGGSTYYLKPQTATGSAAAGEVLGSSGRTAQWNVLNFDLPTRTGAKRENAPAAADVPPPRPN